MSYKALYRKYRPDSFDQVKGQEHVVTALSNQIRMDRIAHAYLFCGTRGTGKTSVAKIFARAVNCEHPADGSPCGTCASCRAIADGSSMNVMEIDAASNNGVDNVRQIREETAYSPTEGRYKVYIIDEVHMLSMAAFNALLKTLEEPPAYVIFILATTEVHKIPLTILSRCQRYDFHRITQGEIQDRLADLLAREEVDFEDKAIRFIARKAEGGMRDALSLTDQCISFYAGQKLTYDNVLKVLGAVDTDRLDKLYRSISSADVAAVFGQLDAMLADGRDIARIHADLTEHIRNILLLKAGGSTELLDVPDSSLELLQQDADEAEGAVLMRYIRILSDASAAMRSAGNKRIVFETALIRLSVPAMESDQQSLIGRIRHLEQVIASGVPLAVQQPAGTVQAVPLPAEEQPVYAAAAPPDLERIRQEWPALVTDIPDTPLSMYLLGSRQMFDPSGGHEGEIYIVVDDISGFKYIKQKEALALTYLEQAIEEKLGKRIAVHLLAGAQAGGRSLQEIKLREAVEKEAREKIHLDVEVEDF